MNSSSGPCCYWFYGKLLHQVLQLPHATTVCSRGSEPIPGPSHFFGRATIHKTPLGVEETCFTAWFLPPAGPHASYACWWLASCSATIPRSSNVSLQYPSQSSNTYSCGSKNIDGPVLTLKSINHGWIPWFNTSSAPDAKWLFFNWQLELQKSTIIHQPKSNCGVYLEVYPNIPKSIPMKAIPRHIQQTHSTVMSMCNSPPQLNHGFWRVFDIKGKQVFHPASYMQVYLQIYHPKTQELAGLLSKAQVPGMRWQGGLRCFRHLVSMDSIVARHPRHLEMFCPGLDDPRDIWEVNFLYKHTYVLAFQKLLLDVLKHSKASWLDDFIWHVSTDSFFLAWKSLNFLGPKTQWYWSAIGTSALFYRIIHVKVSVVPPLLYSHRAKKAETKIQTYMESDWRSIGTANFIQEISCKEMWPQWVKAWVFFLFNMCPL